MIEAASANPGPDRVRLPPRGRLRRMSAPRRSGLISYLRVRPLLRGVNKVARAGIRAGVRLSYHMKIRRIRRAHPAYFGPLAPALEARHRAYWRSLTRRVDPSWLRYFTHVSGIADPRYVPDDLYHSIIERRLNDLDHAWYYADKNMYERLFDRERFVVTRLRNVSDTYLDRDFRPMTREAFAECFRELAEDCFIKPAVGSGGGRRITLVRRERGGFRTSDGAPFTFDDLERRYRRDYVVQPVVRQHPALARFNPDSVNTLRVMTYRSVKDEAVVPLKATIRFGRRSMIVDNQTQGGVACGVRPDGTMLRHATTETGLKLTEHPDSGIAFDGVPVPNFAAVIEVVSEIARAAPPLRLLSFDVAIGERDSVCVVEINTRNQEVNFLQTSGGPLFGEYSDEVVAWCAERPERDGLRVVRF